ncbi:MAG TPA: HEPN domain-containing protein [Prolixibacteraceae bacterium]|nr:HEPN domain-containing protein [Prolixibacteraceae bacterium]
MSDFIPEDYIEYRITRSKETIEEVRVHIENRFWNTAINRMYYACFYAVSALLAKDKIEVSSHTGVRQKFGEYYVKTGKINRDLARHFTELSEKRHKGDYNDFYDYDEETVIRLYPVSKRFIEEIISILTN